MSDKYKDQKLVYDRPHFYDGKLSSKLMLKQIDPKPKGDFVERGSLSLQLTKTVKDSDKNLFIPFQLPPEEIADLIVNLQFCLNDLIAKERELRK